MVGLFSRLYGGRGGHRRTQSAIDVREPSRESSEEIVCTAVPSSDSDGVGVSVEFKPVVHPTEPLDHGQPVRCPLPEPYIINDGRIWKECITANAEVTVDLPVVKESSDLKSETADSKAPLASAKHVILASHSSPDHNLVGLLENCRAS